MHIALQGFDSNEFLQHYWQRKHGLFRQAIPNAASLLDANELAGLALEDPVESRLIAGPDMALRHGPFDEATLQQFPQKDATLLVQAVDHYFPQIAALRDAFDFLPAWRVDDIMISFASDGGGVGPHYDQYDVFLIQGEGQREWRIGPHTRPGEDHINTSGLRMLAPYEPIETIILEAGDMLYIPPGVAHWGISQGNSLCLSVGFRAPAYHEILQQWADDLADQLDESLRYRDPLTESLSRHELSASNLRNLHQLLTEQLTPESLAAATAKLVSEPKYNHPIEPIMPATDDEPLYKAADARLLLCNDMLYANGEALACSAKLPRPLLLSLCNDDMIDSSMRQTLLANTEGQAFLQTLLALGVFEVDDDDFQ